MKETVRIVPLGGLGEIGMNMMVLECNGDAIMVDCGQRMPEPDAPGVDMLVPDISHLETMKSKVRGILLTHGHEDHIGALPYLWDEIEAPLYGRELTMALVREKLQEFELHRRVPMNVVEPLGEVTLGCFRVKFVPVTHSIAQASSLIIETPAGTLVHSGDYSIDETPTDGNLYDFETLRAAGDAGVLALFADSTNVDTPGRTLSESALRPTFERLIGDAEGTVIVGCFASATHRIRLVCEMARQFDRRLVPVGRSMIKNIRICRDLGLLDVPADLLVDPTEFPHIPPRQRLVLATGTQGEPMSALTRIAYDEHRHIKAVEGDALILSARIIPGNERSIFSMLNHFARRGVEVHRRPHEEVHTSGHAQRDEMRTLIGLVRPKHLIPVHGEIRHLIAHARLGEECGIPRDNIFVLENGNILNLSATGARRAGDCVAGRVCVDGLGVGDISEVVLRDRKRLARDGMVVVTLVVNRQTREIEAGPDIASRGVADEEEGDSELLEQCRVAALAAFKNLKRESREEMAVIEEAMRRAIRRLFRKSLDRRPTVLPIVIEI